MTSFSTNVNVISQVKNARVSTGKLYNTEGNKQEKLISILNMLFQCAHKKMKFRKKL